jgi:membrane-associated phospholipid phosphatase
MWISITDLGDAAVGLTLAALVWIALLASGWMRGAMAWLITVAGCGAVMAVFKAASGAVSLGCGPTASVGASFSPSGHAALSAVVYGGLAVLTGRQLPSWARMMFGLASAALIVLIATSRVAIQAHTPVEVVSGLCVGLGAVALLIYLLRHKTAPRLLVPQLLLALAVALVWTYGTHLPVEETLHRFSAWIRQSAGACTH